MKFFASICNFFQQREMASVSSSHCAQKDKPRRSSQDANEKSPGEFEHGLDFLDGMSTGTARFIIDREVSPDLLDRYDIKDLENKGRYYLAKIVKQDGEVADTVLIDKLNRSIHFQKANFR